MGFFWTKFMFIYSLYKYNFLYKIPWFLCDSMFLCFFKFANIQYQMYIYPYIFLIVIKGEKPLNTCELIKSHLILQRGHLY